MTPEQRAYLAGRRRQIRYWPWMAAVIVALVAGFYGWLWSAAPININTSLVLQEFHTRTLTHEELVMLAARGTLALIACGLFVLVLVLLVSVALWNESRLLALLDATGATAAPDGPAGAADDTGAAAVVPDLPADAGGGAEPAAGSADAGSVEAGASGADAPGPR